MQFEAETNTSHQTVREMDAVHQSRFVGLSGGAPTKRISAGALALSAASVRPSRARSLGEALALILSRLWSRFFAADGALREGRSRAASDAPATQLEEVCRSAPGSRPSGPGLVRLSVHSGGGGGSAGREVCDRRSFVHRPDREALS